MKIVSATEYIFNTTQSDLTRYNGTVVYIERPLTEMEEDNAAKLEKEMKAVGII